MKHALLCVAVLLSSSVSFAANAAPVIGTPIQSICEIVIVQTPEGPVEGVLCYPQGGRL